jgi:Undecaprenyl-phosphate glucose phosphotransferase
MRHFDLDQPQRFHAWPGMPPAPGPMGSPARRPSPVAHVLRSALLGLGRVLEGGAVVAAGLLAPGLADAPAADPLAVALAALAAVQAFGAMGLYDGEDGYGSRRNVALILAVAAAMVPPAAWAAAWLAGRPSPVPVEWAVLAGLGAAAARGLWGIVMLRLARWTMVARRILVVGDRDRALEVLSVLSGDGRRWAVPVGICLDRGAPPVPSMGGFIAPLEDAERLAQEQGVDDVVVALPWSDSARIARCLDALRPLAVDVHLFPEAADPFLGGHAHSLLAGVPMAKVGARPLAGARAFLKAAEDRVLAALILLPLLPLLAAIAVAIKLDSKGPVLFRQQRYGFDNRPFTCFKFRSMVARPAEAEVRQATRDDPRVTRVGRFLRRTSLDELPQLFNVINGTMSLVGPRPHAVSHHHYYARLVDDYRCRHRMKPGITGWAQINGCRGETATVDMMRKRVVHDLWYIDHWSLWLDLKILARTPLACLKGTNAY